MKLNGLVIVGYPYAGKSEIANELAKSISNAQVIDKSKYLTYIPLSLGYNEDDILENKSIDDLIEDVHENKDSIDPDISRKYTRTETILFSDKLKKHFGKRSGYNHKVTDSLILPDKFPIIAGPRYMETLVHYHNLGYGIVGLEMLNQQELKKRSSDFTNLKQNGSPLEQIEMEKQYFDVEKMMYMIKNNQSSKYKFIKTENKLQDDIAKEIIKHYNLKEA